MQTPAIRHTKRLLLRLTALFVCTIPAAAGFGLLETGAAYAAASSSPSKNPVVTASDRGLESHMLAVPLPGLSDFALVGPGATNGVLTAQTLGTYSSNPGEVESLFNQYRSEPGFAGWIKTWQNSIGSEQVVEVAIRFHDAFEANQNASAFVATLSTGLSRGAKSHDASITGATAFTIDEPSTTSGTTTVPAQQVQAVVYAQGDYLIALHTDSPDGNGLTPIAPGTAMALALQQHQDLAPLVRAEGSAAVTGTTKSHNGKSGSATLVVGIVLLLVVVVVIVGFAFFYRFRKPALGGHAPQGSRKAQETEAPARDGSPVQTDERWGNARNGWGRDDLAKAGTNGATNHGNGRIGRNGKNGKPAEPGNGIAVPAKVGGGERARVRNGRALRAQQMEETRTNHPSAVALAQAKPPVKTPGWYEDPSDANGRRIRYWDGDTWTSHVAEPEQ
jgi:Protein of unknown function (DUF2510)